MSGYKKMENENIVGGCSGKGCEHKTAENDVEEMLFKFYNQQLLLNWYKFMQDLYLKIQWSETANQ